MKLTREERLEMLLTLVRDMRASQKDYFKMRTRPALLKAKNLEEQVDIQLLHFAGTFEERPSQGAFPGMGGRR